MPRRRRQVKRMRLLSSPVVQAGLFLAALGVAARWLGVDDAVAAEALGSKKRPSIDVKAEVKS